MAKTLIPAQRRKQIRGFLAAHRIARLMIQRKRGSVIVVADGGLEPSGSGGLQERGVRVLIAGESGDSDGRHLPQGEKT